MVNQIEKADKMFREIDALAPASLPSGRANMIQLRKCRHIYVDVNCDEARL
jgi:hypothetical protein